MSTAAMYWTMTSALAALALAAAVFHRAVTAASPARLEELNEQLHSYPRLPDMDDALIAAGWFKAVVYCAFAAAVAVSTVVERDATIRSYLMAAAGAATVVVVCEAFALVTAGYHAGKAFYGIVPLVAAFAAFGRAVTVAGKAMAGVTARIAGRDAPAPADEAAEEDILDAVVEGTRQGFIEDEQREMIESIIEFKDVEVSRIMTPRTDVVTVGETFTIAEAIETAVRSGHSRLPVCATTADNIVGVLHVKDIMALADGQKGSKTLVRDIMRPPRFVPETKRIRDLLQEFRASNVHLAIVLDEYGGTSGIVTIEDILEEIVGEIEDEYDEHEPPTVKTIAPGKVLAEGHAEVSEVGDAIGIEFPESDEYETIAGLVLYHTGRIPALGETFEFDGAVFKVADVDQRRIKRLAIEAAPGDAGARTERK